MRETVHEARRDICRPVRAELLIGSAGCASSRLAAVAIRRSTSEDRRALPASIADAEEGRTIGERWTTRRLLYRAYEIIAMLYRPTPEISISAAGGRERWRRCWIACLHDRERVDVLVSVGFARIEAGRYREALRPASRRLSSRVT